MRMALIRLYFKSLLWICVGIAGVLILATICMPIYDWAFPWSEAVTELKREGVKGSRWMIGFSYEKSERDGEIVYEYEERVFAMLPTVFTDGKVFVASTDHESRGSIRIERISVVKFVVKFIAELLIVCIATWSIVAIRKNRRRAISGV